MATIILCVMFVCFLLGAAFTLPVSQESNFLKSVPSSGSLRYVKLNGRPVVFNPDAILVRGEDTEQVNSLDTVLFDSGLKRKRQVINGNHSCAKGMVWFWNMCVTLEKYKKLTDDDYEDS